MAKVGVLIAAKDAAATIGRAVASALTQAAVSEVIVVDDGSADDTAAQAWRQDDGTGRLHVRALEGNFGPSVARNHALACSTADVVAVLDADDYFLPGRIATMLAEAGTDWDFVSDGLIMVRDGQPDSAAQRHDYRAEIGADTLSAETFIAGNVSRRGRMRRELGFMKPLVRRDFLNRAGLRYDPRLRLGEDFILYAEALLRGARFRLTSGCFYVAVWRPESISGRHSAEDLSNLAQASLGLMRLASVTESQKALIGRHARSVMLKSDYRVALDLKQQRRLLELVAFLTTNLRSVPYMIRETTRAMSGG
jgi:succinoglycan biosynthesis protein ExoU